MLLPFRYAFRVIQNDKPKASLFAPFWRWHFYASLLVIPILAMLAITGLTYMYRFEIQAAVHPGVVAGFSHENAKSLDDQTLSVMKAYPKGSVLSVTEPWADRATQFVVQNGDQTLAVFVNPETAKVTGAFDPKAEISDFAIRLHGDLTAGRIGDGIIELGACWAIVMALTGYYLFFKMRKSRKRDARAEKAERKLNPFTKFRLRNQHSVAGAVAGLGILFLVVSGLPWTGFWGDAFQSIATGQGQSFWGEDPGAESKFGKELEKASGQSAPAPWVLGESKLPKSSSQSNSSKLISVDYLAGKAQKAGLPRPYLIVFPEGETGVYSVVADQWEVKGNPAFQDVTREAVIHFDRYSGEIAGRYSYDQYSTLAKVVSNSIALHEGRRFGIPSQIASTAFCIGVLFLCVTAPIMWWRRRKVGQGLGAPKGELSFKEHPWIYAMLIILGVVLPLFGISLVLVLVIDQVLKRIKPIARFLGK